MSATAIETEILQILDECGELWVSEIYRKLVARGHSSLSNPKLSSILEQLVSQGILESRRQATLKIYKRPTESEHIWKEEAK